MINCTRDSLAELQEMRYRMQRQIDALDVAIGAMQAICGDDDPPGSVPVGVAAPVATTANDAKDAQTNTPRKTRRKKQLTDIGIDLSSIPDYNPHGGGIRIDD